jgi:hypothetical protein
MIPATDTEDWVQQMKWRDMKTAPKTGDFIVVKPKRNQLMIVSWDVDGRGGMGWWLPEEDAIIPEDQLEGWYPIPQDHDPVEHE